MRLRRDDEKKRKLERSKPLVGEVNDFTRSVACRDVGSALSRFGLIVLFGLKSPILEKSNVVLISGRRSHAQSLGSVANGLVPNCEMCVK